MSCGTLGCLCLNCFGLVWSPQVLHVAGQHHLLLVKWAHPITCTTPLPIPLPDTLGFLPASLALVNSVCQRDYKRCSNRQLRSFCLFRMQLQELACWATRRFSCFKNLHLVLRSWRHWWDILGPGTVALYCAQAWCLQSDCQFPVSGGLEPERGPRCPHFDGPASVPDGPTREAGLRLNDEGKTCVCFPSHFQQMLNLYSSINKKYARAVSVSFRCWCNTIT